MTNEYTIQREENAVTICLGKDCDFLDGFLDIYIDYDESPSPFKTLDDAELFARIIVKLLKVVS